MTILDVYYMYLFYCAPHKEKYISILRINWTLICGDVNSVKYTRNTRKKCGARTVLHLEVHEVTTTDYNIHKEHKK